MRLKILYSILSQSPLPTADKSLNKIFCFFRYICNMGWKLKSFLENKTNREIFREGIHSVTFNSSFKKNVLNYTNKTGNEQSNIVLVPASSGRAQGNTFSDGLFVPKWISRTSNHFSISLVQICLKLTAITVTLLGKANFFLKDIQEFWHTTIY